MIDIEKALQDIENVIGILAGAITIAKLLRAKPNRKDGATSPVLAYIYYIS